MSRVVVSRDHVFIRLTRVNDEFAKQLKQILNNNDEETHKDDEVLCTSQGKRTVPQHVGPPMSKKSRDSVATPSAVTHGAPSSATHGTVANASAAPLHATGTHAGPMVVASIASTSPGTRMGFQCSLAGVGAQHRT